MKFIELKWCGSCVGFHEVSARRSDFAFVSAGAQVALDPDGTCKRIAIGVGAVTNFPVRLKKAEQQLTDSTLEPRRVGSGDDQAVTAASA